MTRILPTLRFRIFAAALLLAAAAAPAIAQAPDIGFAAGDSVVLAAPRWLRARGHGGLMSLGEKYTVEIGVVNGQPIARDSAGVALADWRATGFPNGSAFRIREIRTVGGSGGRRMVQVTLRTRGELGVELLAPVGEEAAFAAFLAPAAQADSVHQAAYRAIGDAFFSGALATAPATQRNAMLVWADTSAKMWQVHHETYRNAEWFSLPFWNDGTVWNDLVITRPVRLGRVLNAVFPYLKGYARAAGNAPLAGLKLTTFSCHGTGPGYTDGRCDHVIAYFPSEALRLFADDEITAQELLTRSVLLENDLRSQLDLSSN